MNQNYIICRKDNYENENEKNKEKYHFQREVVEKIIWVIYLTESKYFFSFTESTFFWTPINAFKTFFGKPVIFKVPLRAHNTYII